MKKFVAYVLAATALVVAPAAFAAPTITGITITGTSGLYSWSTSPSSTQDTLFIAHDSGAGVKDVVNKNNDFSSIKFGKADQDGDYDFTLYGDGLGPVVQNAKGKILSAPNSDATYSVTVMVKDGKKTGTLSGVYVFATNSFTSTGAAFSGNTGTYQIDTFDWGRQLKDYVGKRSTSTASDAGATLADYRGDLSLTSSAVPEPATWAMMLLGFGMVGVGLRYRRKSTSVRFA